MSATVFLPDSLTLSSLWIASLWQGFVLAAFTTLLLRAIPDLSPRLRYRVWFAGYAACALLPVAEWLASVHSSLAHPLAAGSVTAFSPLLTIDSRWTLLCGGLWMAGSLFGIARLAAGLWSIRRVLRSAVTFPLIDKAKYSDLRHLRSRGDIVLYVSEEIEAPVAAGFPKPAIILPRTLLADLSDEQMQQVLRHELEHLERRDDWTMLLLGCMRCIFPLHVPLMWFERQLVTTREMACDDAVLRSAAPRAYAMNLAQIAEFVVRRSPRALPNLLGTRSQLGRRIEHILSGRKESNRQESNRMATGALFAATAGLMAVCALLVHSPALVAFQAPVQTAAFYADLHPRTPLPPTLVPASFPSQVRRVTGPRHRTRATTRAPRLLVSAPTAVVPGQTRPTVLPQPEAMLVLWNDSAVGFSATLVFDVRPCLSSSTAARRDFFLLQI